MASASVRARRTAVRVVIVLALAALGVLMYHIGKEYRVILDNETVTIDGREYAAVEYGSLILDGNEAKALEIWEDDRLLQPFVGASHTLTLNVLNDDDEIVETIERKIQLDFDTRQWMVSLAALAGKSENLLIPNPMYSGEPEIVPDEEEATEAGVDEMPVPEF